MHMSKPSVVNRHAIYIEAKIWEGVKPILDEVGLSRSQFAELTFKYLIESKDKSLKETQEGLFSDILRISKKVKPKERFKKKKG